MQNKTMKSVIAAVAMLLLLTLTMVGAKNVAGCEQNQRAKAGNLEWRNNASLAAPEANPAC